MANEPVCLLGTPRKTTLPFSKKNKEKIPHVLPNKI
jgi:hypothetical protein